MFELRPADEVPDPLAPYLDVDRSRPRHACWVAGHMVAGLDGTAAIGGRVGALSGDADYTLFRRMRQLADVVMVGAETVRREGYAVPRLAEEARAERVARGKPPTPPLAVFSRSLDLDLSRQAFAKAPEHAPTMIITCASADPDRLRAAEAAADVVVAGEERVEPRVALERLAERGHEVVVCEGGPTVLGQFAADGCLDELFLTLAPIMGGDPLPVAVTPPGGGLSHFALRHVLDEDGTLFLRYERTG